MTLNQRKSIISRLALEPLEDRSMPSAAPWGDPGHLTLSFVPDGTQASGSVSDLSQMLSAYPDAAWKTEILRAFQTWAAGSNLNIGLVGPYPNGSPEAVEVRAFSPMITSIEDPVTGSLNASLAQWLLAAGRIKAPYVASQGTVLGRRGRVHVARDHDGQVWIGGATVTCVSGTVEL